jgi:hypothetical protein
MNYYKEIIRRNSPMVYSGMAFLVLAIILVICAGFNTTQILGTNAMIKPLKFALSTWIYFWTLAYLLYYVNNQSAVKKFTILAIVTMVFENAVITIQAFRGQLSHFHVNSYLGGILYALMGVMIVWVSTATLVLAIRFIRQKTYAIKHPFALSIKIGLCFFVFFSFFGGYMSAINSHNVGGPIGQTGLPLLNWSTLFGDLRVAHFFGIHSLQIIPLVGYYCSEKISNVQKASSLIWLISIVYFLAVGLLAVQALMGLPFIKL